MIPGGIEVNLLAKIRLTLEAKFGDDQITSLKAAFTLIYILMFYTLRYILIYTFNI